jgi:hypothetical protein
LEKLATIILVPFDHNILGGIFFALSSFVCRLLSCILLHRLQFIFDFSQLLC